MCEHCLDEITEGKRPPVTDEMWELAGLCWDWYRLDGNATGGALHVVLDDMNIEDQSITYCREHLGTVWLNDGPEPAPATMVSLGAAIVDGLMKLTEGERAMVVHVADVYDPVRPAKL